MILFQSFHLLQQEKLMVIKKELQHLYHIAHFYKSPEESQRGKIASRLCEDIKLHNTYISTLNSKININYKQNKDSTLQYLTFYDLHNSEITDLLKVGKMIQSKLSQFLQDRFNQYLPIPMTTKRYSSKGFLDYLNQYYENILKNYGDDIKPPMIFWGHVSDFTTEKSLKESNNDQDSTYYIETAYWNYEIPFLLPIITHELGHIILDSHTDNTLKKLKYTILEILQVSDAPNELSEGFVEELVSDIFAYTIHGYPYLIVMCHELLGKDFAPQFYSDINNDINISPIDSSNEKFIQAFIRIKTLLNFIEIYDEEYDLATINKKSKATDIQKVIKKIHEVINFFILKIPNAIDREEDYDTCIRERLYALSNTETCIEPKNLAEIYSSCYPGLLQDYIIFHNSISYTTNLIYENKNFDETHIRPLLKEIQKDTAEFKNKFTDVTDARFKDLSFSISKNKFRQLLLNEENAKPYELTLYKTRTDAKSVDYFPSLEKEIKSSYIDTPAHKSKDIYITFGFFNALSLTEKEEKLTQTDIDNMLKSAIPTKVTPFYHYKYSLIKLWDNHKAWKDYNKSSTCENNGLHIIIQLQLIKNTTCMTNKALEELKKHFTDSKNVHYKNKIEIYKALGPKEIIIKYHNISKKPIQDIRQPLLDIKFKNDNIFRRSYTIVYDKYDHLKKIEVPMNVMTIIRKKSNISITAIQDSCKTDIEHMYYTSGVTDIQIHWNSKTTIRSILAYYDTWTENAYTTDIQTHIIQPI